MAQEIIENGVLTKYIPDDNQTSATISDEVTSIGNNAFQDCTSLEKITLPEGLTSIGRFAFYRCENLKEITLPEGLTSIKQFAFYNCEKLKEITLPEGLTNIGLDALRGCTSLEKITVPASFNRDLLHNVGLPENVEIIQNQMGNNNNETEDLESNDNETELISAAQNGHLDIVNKCIDAGANVNQADDYGATALMRAAESGHLDVVNRLIDAGANVNLANNNGETALLRAAIDGRLEIVNNLIEAGADVDKAKNSGYTALMFAAQFGHLDIVKRLLEAGANVDQADINGSTALIVAAHTGQRESIRMLIDNNADYNAISKGLSAKDYAQTEELSEHLQKCINEHQYDVLIEQPKYNQDAVFEELKLLTCPLSLAPISYLLCAKTGNVTYKFEKSELTKHLNESSENPLNRQKLTLDECFNDDDEQKRIDDLWGKVNELYNKYQNEPSNQAQVSMFSLPPTAVNNKDSEQEESVQSQKRISK